MKKGKKNKIIKIDSFLCNKCKHEWIIEGDEIVIDDVKCPKCGERDDLLVGCDDPDDVDNSSMVYT